MSTLGALISKNQSKEKMHVDIVVTWVDMNDPKWQESFNLYADRIDNSKNELSEARFRDYGLLKYWFRGVEKFAPWVRYVHFVTCGQKPDWLNEKHPQIKLVDHKDFIPNQFLPIFNSALIEAYMHCIPELSERFVYFNDDFYITNDLPLERFFVNGLPNDIAAFRYNSGIGQWAKRIKNNVRLINERFDKRKVLKRDHDKWFHPSYGKKANITRLLKYYNKFVTLRTPHNAQPYLKQTFEEVWEYAGDRLTEFSKNRFRSLDDYTPELFRTWQICQSNFNPYNTYQDTKMFPLIIKPKQAVKAVRNQTYKLVCLNDNQRIRNYNGLMSEIDEAFKSILPDKSLYEL